MYVALFEISSKRGCEQYIVCGDSLSDLLYNFEKIQNLSCLIKMGKSRECGAELLAIGVLESILVERDFGRLTEDKLLELDIKISIGKIKCVEIIKGENAIKQLKSKYPYAKEQILIIK